MCLWTEMPYQTFNCPSVPSKLATDPHPQVGAATVIPNWVPSNNRPGYRYDWAVPSRAAAVRAVLSDRAVTNATPSKLTWHGNRAVIGFVDGHVNTLRQTVTANIATNISSMWTNVQLTFSVASDLVPGDGIWDLGGDDGLQLRQGRGSRTRAFTK
jgi:prepilin-type processing-associated H-X9-DG protein